MFKRIKTVWKIVRRLSGDDAYERYLEQYGQCRNCESDHRCAEPLSRAEFFKQWQEQKWHGIKRCC